MSKKHYKMLAAKFHPDKWDTSSNSGNFSTAQIAAANEILKNINEFYATSKVRVKA